MAGSFNKVILMGNMTRDVELRYTPSGTAVTDIGLAVNEKRKNQAGELVEETTFVDVTLWGRNAEVAGEYLAKGSPILIEGRLKLDQWETDDGERRQKLKVVCDRMQMVGSKRDGGGNGGGGNRQSKPADTGSQDGGDDDVPF
jgi:single-strand DNA-binding protein